MKKNMIIICLFCLSILLYGCNSKENNERNHLKKISAEQVEKLLKTKKVIIEDARLHTTTKEISNLKDINQIVDILSNGYEVENVVTSEESNWYLFLYDSDNQLIDKIWMWESGYFGFKNNKEYELSENINDFKTIIDTKKE